MMISLDEFVDDEPWEDTDQPLGEMSIPDQIEGVVVRRLTSKRDGRGDLTVLFSTLLVDAISPPHVYLVTAAPRSVRAWVYHKRQSDRLAFTNGTMRVVLFDGRPDSPTFEKVNVIDAGSARKLQVTIPPLVIHGVQNLGDAPTAFINMPTNAYDPNLPDKSRVPFDHPGIPYRFE